MNPAGIGGRLKLMRSWTVGSHVSPKTALSPSPVGLPTTRFRQTTRH